MKPGSAPAVVSGATRGAAEYDTSVEESKQIVRAFYESYNDRNLGASWDRYISLQVAMHVPPGTTATPGWRRTGPFSSNLPVRQEVPVPEAAHRHALNHIMTNSLAPGRRPQHGGVQ